MRKKAGACHSPALLAVLGPRPTPGTATYRRQSCSFHLHRQCDTAQLARAAAARCPALAALHSHFAQAQAGRRARYTGGSVTPAQQQAHPPVVEVVGGEHVGAEIGEADAQPALRNAALVHQLLLGGQDVAGGFCLSFSHADEAVRMGLAMACMHEEHHMRVCLEKRKQRQVGLHAQAQSLMWKLWQRTQPRGAASGLAGARTFTTRPGLTQMAAPACTGPGVRAILVWPPPRKAWLSQ